MQRVETPSIVFAHREVNKSMIGVLTAKVYCRVPAATPTTHPTIIQVLQSLLLPMPYRKVIADSKKKSFKWTNDRLKAVIQYKKRKEDKAMPTKKDDLLKMWNQIKNRPSPQVSPASSEVEDSSEDKEESVAGSDDESSLEESGSDDEDEESISDESDGGLKFGSDWEDESDDGEDSDDSSSEYEEE